MIRHSVICHLISNQRTCTIIFKFSGVSILHFYSRHFVSHLISCKTQHKEKKVPLSYTGKRSTTLKAYENGECGRKFFIHTEDLIKQKKVMQVMLMALAFWPHETIKRQHMNDSCCLVFMFIYINPFILRNFSSVKRFMKRKI